MRTLSWGLLVLGGAMAVAAGVLGVRDYYEPRAGEGVRIVAPERDLGEMPPGAIVDLDFRVVNDTRHPRQLVNVSRL